MVIFLADLLLRDVNFISALKQRIHHENRIHPSIILKQRGLYI